MMIMKPVMTTILLMTRVWALLIVMFFSVPSYTQEKYVPQKGDLLFCVAGDSDFSGAIADATAWHDTVKFVHVAIVAVEKGKPYIIEATGRKGVTCTDWEEFFSSSQHIGGKPGVVVMRVKPTAGFSVTSAIEKAKTHLGEEYDWSYYPDNGKMYCTELVYECFRKDDGTPLFTARPMNFRNENGEMPAFWTELFEKLGEPIPEGVLGTNPNDMSKEPVLMEVYRFFLPK